jgi:serpin B
MSFIIDIFKKINVPDNENIIISPNSIFQILSLFGNITENDIQKEILNSLKFNNITDLNEHNYNLLKIINNLKCYKSINSIFLKKEFLNKYINLTKNFDIYCDEINSIEQINNWYSQKTNNKILNLINNINNTNLISLNGSYFIDNWGNNFNKEYIKNEIFDNKEKIEMMKQIGFFNYFENDNLQIVEIPLENDNISALILLPSKNKNINQIINELNNNNLELINSNLKNQEIELKLPKLEFNCNYSLIEPLKQLGFLNLFKEKNKIQFNQRIYLNIAEDKKIESGIIYNSNSFINMKHMNVNHPFILIIKINNVKSPFNILFISKISRINELNVINQNNPLIISNNNNETKEINFLPIG